MSNKYPGGIISLGGPESNSNYFNGAAYLSIANNTALDLGTGDYTIEGWWNFSDTSNQALISKYSSGQGFVVQYQSGNLRMVLGLGSFSDAVYAFSWTPVIGTWYHIAITRSGTSGRAFINGVQIGSTTTFTTSNTTSSTTLQIGLTHTVSEYTRGFASNVRVVKGTALYTANFAAPTGPLQNIANTTLLTCQSPTIVDNSTNAFTITNTGGVTISASTPFTAYNPNNLDPALGAATPGVWTLSQALQAEVTRSWPMYDPYYKNVVLNLHGEGTNGAQNNTFLDSSTNNFTITRNGNTTQGSFSPYGSNWSNYFNGSTDFIYNTSGSAQFGLATGDFTIECWACLSSTTKGPIIDLRFGAGTPEPPVIYIETTGVIYFYSAGANRITGSTLSVGTWYHIAVSRASGSTKMFINGTQVGSTYADSNNYGTPTIVNIGKFADSSGYFNGYISNLRVVKGTAVYTNTFTPPTSPLTAITNTSLLTCQSNRFIDNSSNAFTIGVGGTPSVQRFQPFLFNTSYTPSTIGGSGYFDGTGDYLTAASNTALAIGTGQYTFECWIYFNSVTNINEFLYTGTDASAGYLCFYYNGGSLQIVATAGGGPTAASFTFVAGQWYHIAASRDSSNNQRLFVNGALLATATSTNNYTQNGFSAFKAASLNGYCSDVRLLKGTCLYTAAFTPPTAPLTAVTNTSLLLNYTNAGIVDNAMMNDLETVGNAQISTSVKKYGTGSLYFDGTGDYLTALNNGKQFDFGTGDFTIEFWLYANSVGATDQAFIDMRPTSTNGYYPYLYMNTGQITYWLNSTACITSSAGAITTGTWYHIALTRSGTSNKLFINGTQSGSTFVSGTALLCGSGRPVVASAGTTLSASTLNGYIDDLRITKGVARYVANFTPPTSQLQDQ